VGFGSVRIYRTGILAIAVTWSGNGFAADIPITKAPPAVAAAIYDWSGFHLGVNAGGTWGSFDPQTSTVGGGFYNATTAGQINRVGAQTIDPSGFSAGVQAGYDWQFGQFLVGIEADANALHLNGVANGSAVTFITAPARQFVLTSYASSDGLFTLRPRVGFAANNWLFYATGGLALTNVRGDQLFTGSGGALQSAAIDQTKLGYAVGAGAEWGVSSNLSVKAEYLHTSFDRMIASQTSSNIPTQRFVQSEALTTDLVRLGLNYRFGSNGSFVAMPSKAPAAVTWPSWELEAGTRVWLSSGRIGAPQPLFNPAGTRMLSRLTFSGLDGVSGEVFARVDHTNGFFAKGYLGAGGITDGSLNDEDFPGSNAYSNTLSNAKGHIGYGTIDAGYAFLRTPTAKLGAFAGYNYYAEDINTYSCQQLAASTVCTSLPANFLVIAQDGHYNAVRLGLNSQLMLTDRLRLTADAAYLPWVDFTGQDDHNARQLLLPEGGSSGTGVMLETALDYNVSDAWRLGVGGRYWAYKLKSGSTTFDFLGTPPPYIVEPTRAYSERYGVFVQSSYKWGDASPASAAVLPVKAPLAPMNWTGFYVGGHLGGGVSRDSWSDPFGSTPTFIFPGFLFGINDAGFGDVTRGGGPLGGLQVGANWQTGKWVLGVEGALSAADLRGENTCFSGLGGINCEHAIDAIGTATGRVGFAWDRSLVYAKAGGAWTNTNYALMGNTSALTLGTGNTTMIRSGWVAGAGVEYALTDNWTTFIEYDHLGFGSTMVPFPTVALVNARTIGVDQSIDLVKLGIDYKLPWAVLAAAPQ
jgi:opacity protein-like surface antigen